MSGGGTGETRRTRGLEVIDWWGPSAPTGCSSRAKLGFLDPTGRISNLIKLRDDDYRKRNDNQ